MDDAVTQVIVEMSQLQVSDELLVPVGITTPQHQIERLQVDGAQVLEMLREPRLELGAVRLQATSKTVQLIWHIAEASSAAVYPESAFRADHSAYMGATAELAEQSCEIAQRAGGGHAGIAALIVEAENRFAYAHPDVRFTDGLSQVPYLSCGTTLGSCIDINTYLMASLRAAGYEAAYLFGYFFR